MAQYLWLCQRNVNLSKALMQLRCYCSTILKMPLKLQGVLLHWCWYWHLGILPLESTIALAQASPLQMYLCAGAYVNAYEASIECHFCYPTAGFYSCWLFANKKTKSAASTISLLAHSLPEHSQSLDTEILIVNRISLKVFNELLTVLSEIMLWWGFLPIQSVGQARTQLLNGLG